MSAPSEKRSGGDDPGVDLTFQQEVIDIRHDLRNPLGHIMGFAELLQEAAERLGYEESLADLGSMERESERLITSINGVLDPGLLDSGRSDIGHLKESVRQFCAQVAASVERLSAQARDRKDEHFIVDLERIRDSALRLASLSDGALERLRRTLLHRDSVDARLVAGSVLIVDCMDVIRCGVPRSALERVGALHAVFERLCVARGVRGAVWLGYYLVFVPREEGGLKRLADLAILMRDGCVQREREADFRMALAAGDVLTERRAATVVMGEPIRQAVLLAGRVRLGGIALDASCAEELKDHYDCRSEEDYFVLRDRRGW